MKTASAARAPQVFALLFCSVDGFVEDAHRGLEWSTGEPDVFTWHRRRARQTPHIGSMLLGRNTYDHFAEYRPSAEAFHTQPEIAAFMETTPKTVVTNRPASLPSWQGARAAEGSDLSALGRGTRLFQGLESHVHLQAGPPGPAARDPF